MHSSRLVAIFPSWEFEYLELCVCGAVWSLVSCIQIYRANKWVSTFPRFWRYIWVSSSSFGFFIVPHSSFAISEWASESFLHNEPNSVPMAQTYNPPTPTYSDTLGEYRKRDLKEERGINTSYGTLRTLSNPKQSTEDTNKAGKLKGNYVKLRKMRPCLLTWNRLESPNNGVVLCS